MDIAGAVKGRFVKAWIEGKLEHAQEGSFMGAFLEVLEAQAPDYHRLIEQDPAECGRVVGGVVTALLAARAEKKVIELGGTK